MEHYININKIVEAFIQKPSKTDDELPFSEEHGWRVVIVTENMRQGDSPIKINKDNKQACIKFMERLGLTQL
ncbi:hypothetical protein J0X14_14350 [Muricauda sp. CAU 1633]|uniref:hypothetical protein n=1 Tax=Allomuricauda sp. CAU 1633 TaxID=2816036 RepID=UPI001A8E2153|nr:hypothetical protein [Muricauda sp. CAU 1633]MBO0323486.1 hypothetical protein [Muricauda sp. CAU 1633]